VENTGPNDCVVVELLDDDRCDTNVVICSGPYATEAAARAACGSGSLVPVGGICPNLPAQVWSRMVGVLSPNGPGPISSCSTGPGSVVCNQSYLLVLDYEGECTWTNFFNGTITSSPPWPYDHTIPPIAPCSGCFGDAPAPVWTDLAAFGATGPQYTYEVVVGTICSSSIAQVTYRLVTNTQWDGQSPITLSLVGTDAFGPNCNWPSTITLYPG
jgi:hypothetical protein